MASPGRKRLLNSPGLAHSAFSQGGLVKMHSTPDLASEKCFNVLTYQVGKLLQLVFI